MAHDLQPDLGCGRARTRRALVGGLPAVHAATQATRATSVASLSQAGVVRWRDMSDQSDVDPWDVAGPEAMVAWDRDVAPHLPALTGVTLHVNGDHNRVNVVFVGWCEPGRECYRAVKYRQGQWWGWRYSYPLVADYLRAV